MTEFREQQLLFCVEQESLVGMLHFVTFNTLESEGPELSAFMVQKSWLADFVPGGLYRLEIKNGAVVQFIKERDFMITQPYFVMLMERKHAFYDRRDEPFVPQQYYTFSDYRTLLQYSPTKMQRFLIKLCRGGLSLLAVLLPLALLALFGYRMWEGGGGVNTPISLLAALPLTLWSIWALSVLLREGMLRWPYSRYQSMQEDCLRTGGKRSPLGMNPREKKALLICGGLCIFLFALVLLILH